MDLFDTMRLAFDEAFGNRGAMRNCRTELRRRQDDEATIRQLCDRLPARDDEPLAHKTSA